METTKPIQGGEAHTPLSHDQQWEIGLELQATLVELVSHVEGARRKLFETRTAVEKNPLHKQADALAGSLDELQALTEYTRGLLAAPPHDGAIATQAARDQPSPGASADATVLAQATQPH